MTHPHNISHMSPESKNEIMTPSENNNIYLAFGICAHPNFFFIFAKNVFKITKHHQRIINLVYYLLYNLNFWKKWLVYLKNSY